MTTPPLDIPVTHDMTLEELDACFTMIAQGDIFQAISTAFDMGWKHRDSMKATNNEEP